MINSIHTSNFNTQYKTSNPSFGAIHPARYFVKEGGSFVQIDSPVTIKQLHRKLITLLNRKYNYDQKRLAGYCGELFKGEKPEEKAIREKLVKFFMKRDPDYNPNREARTFNHTTSRHELEPYILTGESADKAREFAKNIRDTWHNANDRAEVIGDNLRISFENAKQSIFNEISKDVAYAKRSYHHDLFNYITTILGRCELKNSGFDAFFEQTVKGKKIKYTLVDAQLNGHSWNE